ncbi:hypothetical protein [Herpetosiphon sp. NSE202]|uniref:hypothetical protein n=1 Tax=Herpetosiphon sp. NSE202 TaxID=3351349 RepID=UPI003634A9D1
MELHHYRNTKNRTIIEELTLLVSTSEPDDPYRAVYIMYLDLLADLVAIPYPTPLLVGKSMTTLTFRREAYPDHAPVCITGWQGWYTIDVYAEPATAPWPDAQIMYKTRDRAETIRYLFWGIEANPTFQYPYDQEHYTRWKSLQTTEE